MRARTRPHTSTPGARRSPRSASPPHPHPVGGRHELGQNFLVDRAVIDRIVELAAATDGPLVELGAGGGALTHPLARLGRPLTAVEIDPRRSGALRERLGRTATVVTADALAWRHPSSPHVVLSNVPFHITTALLRSLLAAPGWTDAVLLTQWEVARRRTGVGGTSRLTVEWSPWFEFALDRRVPARAFRPRPSVDGGLFTVRRRSDPLVAPRERRAYQAWVASVFGGPGRGLAQILARSTRPLPVPAARRMLAARGIPADALPKHLDARDWAAIWRRVSA